MLNKKIGLLVILILFVSVSYAQQQGEGYFKNVSLDPPPITGTFTGFDSRLPFFVTVKEDNFNKYLFLFRTEFGNRYKMNCDIELIKFTQKQWSQRHSQSRVIEVWRHPPYPGKTADGSIPYVWLIDGKENFAVRLIRNGVCKSGVVLVEEKSMTYLLVKEKIYRAFKQKILKVEGMAKKEKLGIWKSERTKTTK